MTFTRITGSGKTGKLNNLGSLFADRETIRVYSGDSVSSNKAKRKAKRRSIRLATIKRIIDNVGKYKGKLANGARTDDRTPKLRGTLASRLRAGQKLRIYAEGTLLGIAKVKGKKWSFTPAYKLAGNRRFIFKAQVTDAKGNKLGRASKKRTLILDSKKPKLKITDNITGIANGAITFTFTFSEKVKGFRKSDIRISGGTAGRFTKVNKRVYTLLVSPTANAAGNIVVSVGKKKARDRAGNGNKAKRGSQGFDTKAPSLTITDNTSGSARDEVLFTFTFSEAVSGFTIDDIKITGGSKGTFTVVSNSVYTLLVSPTNNSRGTITVDVAAKVASDAAGNNNTAAIQATQVFDSRTRIELSDVAAGNGGFVMQGQAEGDQSGFSVSSAGDVNGDGIDDLIIGARGASRNGQEYNGSFYVVFGKKAINSPIKLSDIANGNGGFVIFGQSDREHIGHSVSSAGDVNGDGIDDLIIGAPYAEPDGNIGYYAGLTFVVFGSRNFDSNITITDITDGTGGFVINGISDSDFSGLSVSNAGDINGDGIDDLIVGAPYADPNLKSGAGKSYVVFGKKGHNSPIELSEIADGTGGFVISGAAQSDFSGSSVSAAGDVNGDGLADLIIGAPGADPNGTSSGSTYIVFGKKENTGPIELSDIMESESGFVIHGEYTDDYSGYSVSAAGDVNGDGLDDLIIGAPVREDPFDPSLDPSLTRSGKSYVVFGRSKVSNAIQLSDVRKGDGGFVISGQNPGDRSGYSVSTAGDINGDGFDDLIIGSHQADPAEKTNAGNSYVVFGGKDTPSAIDLDEVALGLGGFVIRGEAEADFSGISVSSAGDFNGDGKADLIIGAPYADPNGNSSGSTYVIL